MAKHETKAVGVNELPELEFDFKAITSVFKAGAVPREADYVKLIKYVHYLHQLLGVEGDGDAPAPGLGHGLVRNEHTVLSIDVDALAGTGLSGSKGNFSLSNVSWFYAMMSKYKATHFSVVPGLPGNDTKLSEANFVLLFTWRNSKHVVVRGFATGTPFFDLSKSTDKWLLQDLAPVTGQSQVTRDECILTYVSNNDDIGTEILIFGLDFLLPFSRSCEIIEFTPDTIIE